MTKDSIAERWYSIPENKRLLVLFALTNKERNRLYRSLPQEEVLELQKQLIELD